MNEEMSKEIAEVFVRAKTRRQLEILINGLLTSREGEEIILRWRLVRELLVGRAQRDISHEFSISLGKIARGSRLLKYGPPEFRAQMRKFLEDDGRMPVRLRKRSRKVKSEILNPEP